MKNRAQTAAPAEWRFTGRHMLLLMFAFFGVVIGVNVVLAVASATTWSGLVVQNSYVASQEYQGKRDAMEAQLALGWKPHFSYEPGNARFTIVDGSGSPVDLGTLSLQVNRPIGTKDDVNLTLEPVRRGEYAAALDLAKGVWEIHFIAASTAAGPFEYRHRFTVEAANP